MSHVQDNTHASTAIASLLTDYLEAKSRHDVEATMEFFSRDELVYSDATLGWVTSWEALHGIFSQFMPNWGDGVAYATAILGNDRSAVVVMRDSPELFGAEILVLAAVDIDDKGKITRWVDYWDGRHFGLALLGELGGTPEESFPASFGEENIASAASAEMNALVEQLTERLGRCDVRGASAMFAVDAVLEDMTTHTAVRGRAAIERYLERTIASFPYGAGVGVRRVLGSATAGGFEWVNPHNAAPRGISGITLDPNGNIIQMRSVWNGALVSDQTLTTFTLAALEPSNN
jgi:ketosteroid isomerase-like protein